MSKRPGRVVAKDELIDSVWQGRVVSDSALSRAMSLARAALRTPANPNPIRPVYGIGYVLEPASTARPGSPSPSAQADFVGRSRELDAIRDSLTRRIERPHCGATHLIAGEAGIGKSSVCAEAARLAEDLDFQVRFGACPEVEGAPSLWPWAQVLRGSLRSPPTTTEQTTADRLVDELMGGGESEQLSQARNRFTLFDSVARFLGHIAARRPLLVAIDDLHRADAASLELLNYVATEPSCAAIVLIATYREHEVQASAPHRRAIAELLTTPRAVHQVLRGLSDAEVTELLAARSADPALATPLARTTKGNPLFIRQLLDAIADGTLRTTDIQEGGIAKLPRAIRESIAMHLAALTEEHRQILARISVAGRTFDRVDAAVTSERADANVGRAINEAKRLDLVEASPSRHSSFHFAHALIRDYLYESLGEAERERAHDRLARHLASSPEARRRLAPAVAHHARLALPSGDFEFAEESARYAAEFAATQHAHEDVARNLSYALDLRRQYHQTDPARTCSLLLDLAEAYNRVGDRAQATATCRDAAEIARQLGSFDLVSRAALSLVPSFYSIETALFDEELIGLLELASDLAPTADKAGRSRLLGRLALALSWSEESKDRRVGLCRQAASLAAQSDDPEAGAFALQSQHSALWSPDNLVQRIELAKEATAISTRVADFESNLIHRTMLITDLCEAGEFGEADIEIAQYQRVASTLKQPQATWLGDMFRGMRALLEGRFKELPELIKNVGSMARRLRSNDAENAWAGQTLFAMLETGSGAAMLSMLKEHIARHPRVVLFQAVPPFVAAELGRDVEPLRELQSIAAQGFRRIPRDMNWLGSLTFLALASAELRDSKTSQELLDLLAPFADRFPILGHATVSLGAAPSHLGRLAAVVGDWRRAESYFARGRDMNAAAGARPWLARALFDEGRERILRGQRKHGEDLINQASSLAKSLHMTHLTRRCAAASQRPS